MTIQCPAVKLYKSKVNRMKHFIDVLSARYPEPKCALVHDNPYELIVATILSAQCTDKQVNKVTPALFKKYPTPNKLAKATLADVEVLIHSTGFFKHKAKNLIGMAQAVVNIYNGEIPQNMDELTSLPGVGRKTANVVRANAFNIPSMVVDTHVIRISNKLGFVATEEPEIIEHLLEKLVPRERWRDYSHQVIMLGRELCTAKKTLCDECPVNS
ncbi:hypothetical protein RsTz2092_08690 [Deferribacterales bacterium RsTz2092]|nr:hypothetical protein AGMMS49941_05970 [Deferribacterales bacterium]